MVSNINITNHDKGRRHRKLGHREKGIIRMYVQSQMVSRNSRNEVYVAKRKKCCPPLKIDDAGFEELFRK